MAEHICHNDHGVPFKQECRSTEIPHLFEHLILELQGQAQSADSLRGETEWDWRVDPKGYFHVTVDYENEFLAIGAIRLAERMILALDGKHIERLDMEAELNRLRELARLGREMEPMVWGFSAGNGTEPPTGGNGKEAKGRRRPTRTWEEISLQPAETPKEKISA